MESRQIGNSGILTPAIGMGTWAIGGGSWWGDNDDETSIKTIHSALEGGITWIDTAPVYGFGHSEEVVGNAIKDRRDKVILSTKGGLQWYNDNGTFKFERDGRIVNRDLTSEGIKRDLEYSLKRLQTDYIDVYYTHWQSEAPVKTPIEETMAALMELKKEGKIRAIGASNVTVDHMKEYLKFGQLDVIQEKFSMLDRDVEKELLPFCEENNITLQAYSPLEQGLLTGKIGMEYEVKPGEVRDNRKWWIPENRKYVVDMLSSWSDLTEKYNCPITHLVIAWTIAHSKQINILCGARKIDQVEENIKGASLIVDEADLHRMTKDANDIIAITL